MSTLEWLFKNEMMAVGEAAVDLAEHAVAVFPCAMDKRPRTPHGHREATVDPKQISVWWRQWPEALIGWSVARPLFVLDVDARHRGHESLAELQAQHGPLPKTLTSVTGGGGLHMIFRAPINVRVRQLSGFAAGLDTRVGGRGYIILPPSAHASGQQYRWLECVRPVEAPAWLLDLVCVQSAPATPCMPAPPAGTGRRIRYAAAVLQGEAEAVASAPEGGRNHRLFRAWKRCASDLGDVLDRETVVAFLTGAALTAGLQPGEIARVLR
jgi:hypothetical protein